MHTMALAPVKQRYDSFCEDALALIETAGLASPEQDPQIIGKAFHEACNTLATIHFPDDTEVSGKGPRGLIWSMYSAFDDKKGNELSGAKSLVEVLRYIIKYRPKLEKTDQKRRPTRKEADRALASRCPFYESNRKYDIRKDFVFVLMPFTEKWSDRLWGEHIQEYLRKPINGKRLTVQRADDMFGQGVMEDVYEGIATAGLVIAECTGRNPNVLYELGIAHSIGKRTALLSQREDDIPFDLRRFRFCIYEDNSDGYPKLKHFLQETAREVIGDSR